MTGLQEFVCGIDIGGTKTAIGLVDINGNCVIDSRLKTADYSTPDEFFDACVAEIRRLKREINPDARIPAIGIGAPNGNYYTGKIEFAPNLQWEGVIDLRGIFSERIEIPIALTNDANAAALGEMIYGGAREMKDFIVITIGTGLGSGVVINGELVYGHNGFAGEIGHTNVYPDGRLCSCGKKGCLEAYVSGRGIIKTAMEVIRENGVKSQLSTLNPEELSPRIISSLAEEGDPLAIRVFDKTARILGLQLADCIAFCEPEAIFLFGGITRAGEILMKPTKKYMEEFVLPIYKDKVRLLYSELKGENAAILGAAALGWKELERSLKE